MRFSYPKYSFLFLLCCLQLNSAFAQNWFQSPVYHGRNVYSLHIIDRINIVAAGGNEQNDSLQDIYKSPTGAMTWNFSNNEGGGYIRSLAFSDENKGLAVGYAGKILKTTNAAESWERIFPPSPMTQRNFTTVIYKNPQTAYTFGGRNYSGADTMQTIMRSADGGDTWATVRDQPGRWLKAACFINDNLGFAVGGNGTILKTSDGGNTWNPQPSPVSGRELNAIRFISSTTGYIAGGHYVQFDTTASFRTLLKTTNGGDTWSVVFNEPGGWLTSIDFIDQNTGYIAGDGASLYKTTDGGANWFRVEVAGAQWYSNFNAVKFLDENFGIIGGMYGEIFLFSNESLSDVQTLPASIHSVTDTNASAVIRAQINTHGIPSRINFWYATQADFSDAFPVFIPIYPVALNSFSDSIFEVSINNLIPQTTYYYFPVLTSAAGTVFGDTLSFHTAYPYTQLSTLPPEFPTGDSALMKGVADGFQQPVNLWFEYGMNNGYGNIIAASPASISDNQYYEVSAPLQGLSQGSYYYRLIATDAYNTFYGNPQSFFHGQIYQSIETLPASEIGVTSATLNGSVYGFLIPVQLSFEYGTTPALGNEIIANPDSVFQYSPITVSAQLQGLTTGQLYYYRIKAQTDFGSFTGMTQTFTPFPQGTIAETRAAASVTYSSAQLRGRIAGFSVPASLEFEYGLTPAMENSIIATPQNISDNAEHIVMADVSGLQAATLYYYRLKVNFQGGFQLLGNTRQVYTSEPEIPNWNFDEWENISAAIPQQWMLPADDFQQVPGVNGSALRIKAKNAALLGMPVESEGDEMKFTNGCPIDFAPDSLVMTMKYDIDAGDSALVISMLSHEGTVIGYIIHVIEGSSNGNFARIAEPYIYLEHLVPDSFFVVVSPFVLFDETGANCNLQSFVEIDDFNFTPPSPPLCNIDFETWIPFSIEAPQHWVFSKFAGTQEPILCVTPSYFEQQNDLALKLQNIFFNNYWYAGIIGLSKNDFNGSGYCPGIPISNKYKHLNGYYKFASENNDTALFRVFVYENGEIVGKGSFYEPRSLTEWTPLDIEIKYLSETAQPDSTNIIINSNTNARIYGNSVLQVDKLSFDGFWQSDGGIIVHTENKKTRGWKVYPNPAAHEVFVVFNEDAKMEKIIELINLNGKVVSEISVARGQQHTRINLNTVDAGFYFLRCITSNEFFAEKIAVVK